MEIMEMFLFAVGCIGGTAIVVESSISRYFKENILKKYLSDRLYKPLMELTGCFQCSGFWVGLIAGILFFGYPTREDLHWTFNFICNVRDWVFAGFASSILSYTWAGVFTAIESAGAYFVNSIAPAPTPTNTYESVLKEHDTSTFVIKEKEDVLL